MANRCTTISRTWCHVNMKADNFKEWWGRAEWQELHVWGYSAVQSDAEEMSTESRLQRCDDAETMKWEWRSPGRTNRHINSSIVLPVRGMDHNPRSAVNHWYPFDCRWSLGEFRARKWQARGVKTIDLRVQGTHGSLPSALHLYKWMMGNPPTGSRI